MCKSLLKYIDEDGGGDDDDEYSFSDNDDNDDDGEWMGIRTVVQKTQTSTS